jgi:signal transduction histidine kinase
MKGSWVTTFAVGGVILLLTFFLGLQYNWLVRAGDAERERMQRRVEADTRGFADDFNREIQAAFFNFQTDAKELQSSDWSEFNERYDYWRSKTYYPELIKDLYLLGNDQPMSLRYDAQARTFTPSELPLDLAGLRDRLTSESARSPFHEELNLLVMPIHDAGSTHERIMLRREAADHPPRVTKVDLPEPKGYLFIVLNPNVITGNLLPDLTARHFPEGNYKVAVKNRSEAVVYESSPNVTAADAKAGLVNLLPDNMIFFSDRAKWKQLQSEKEHSVMVDQRVESQTFTHTETDQTGTKTGKFTIELKPGPGSAVRSRSSLFTASTAGNDPWTLNVQHTAGSIDAFTKGEFRKNFLIGFALYLLLVGAIAAIVISALRAKRFAQRQIDFVSSVSHEFRTPLAVIYSASENLVDGVASDREQVARYGGLIKGEGRKLSAMVEQILQFAGARSGKRKYNFAPANPRDLVDAAIDECRPILDEEGFEVETSVDEALPALIVDADALTTALQNLISNSVKYSNGERWIKVTASNGKGTIKLTVEDRGIGLATDDLKHVFEPFYRAKDVVDAQIHGNGLGLALVKEIAEAHGGSVKARSELGKGSEFTIELPSNGRG